MCLRIRRFKDYSVTDRVKARVFNLESKDFFEHMGTLYRVTQITKQRIYYKELCEYTYEYGFGRNSKQFVYKVLVN